MPCAAVFAPAPPPAPPGGSTLPGAAAGRACPSCRSPVRYQPFQDDGAAARDVRRECGGDDRGRLVLGYQGRTGEPVARGEILAPVNGMTAKVREFGVEDQTLAAGSRGLTYRLGGRRVVGRTPCADRG